jgi:hypothetical protein
MLAFISGRCSASSISLSSFARSRANDSLGKLDRVRHSKSQDLHLAAGRGQGKQAAHVLDHFGDLRARVLVRTLIQQVPGQHRHAGLVIRLEQTRVPNGSPSHYDRQPTVFHHEQHQAVGQLDALGVLEGNAFAGRRVFRRLP